MAKKVIYTLVITLLGVSNLYSQINYNTKLDERNGFKIFTFGDSKSLYDGLLSYRIESTMSYFEDMDNFKLYRYLEAEPNELFRIKWDSLELGFTKNILTKIQIEWKPLKSWYEEILRELKYLFGSPNSESSLKHYKTHMWSGKNVTMKLSIYKLNPKHDKIQLEIENKYIAADLLHNPKKQF